MVSRFGRVAALLIVALALAATAVSVPAAAAQTGFPLSANTAFCDPGYLGPFVDCTPWEGVTVSFVATDQAFQQSCLTAPGDRTASCTVEVPFGSTIVASIDPGIIPAGYVLEGPASMEFAIPDGPPDGIFGGPSFVLLPAEGMTAEQPADTGFPFPVNTAFCEPGYMGPFVDCSPWQGVEVSVSTMDGSFVTSCITSGTERAAGCVVDVPFGSTVLASIDPAAIPAGYVLEGPSTVEVAIPSSMPDGVFGGAAFVLLPASQESTATATEDAPPAAGDIPAALYRGSCADLQPDDPVATLTGVGIPAGDPVGATDAVPAATSFTVLDVPFEQVIDGAHVVAVFDAASPGTMVACGTIGGTLDPNGALSIGLRPVSDANIAGIAYIGPADDGTATVSMFVMDLGGDGGTDPAATTDAAARRG